MLFPDAHTFGRADIVIEGVSQFRARRTRTHTGGNGLDQVLFGRNIHDIQFAPAFGPGHQIPPDHGRIHLAESHVDKQLIDRGRHDLDVGSDAFGQPVLLEDHVCHPPDGRPFGVSYGQFDSRPSQIFEGTDSSRIALGNSDHRHMFDQPMHTPFLDPAVLDGILGILGRSRYEHVTALAHPEQSEQFSGTSIVDSHMHRVGFFELGLELLHGLDKARPGIHLELTGPSGPQNTYRHQQRNKQPHRLPPLHTKLLNFKEFPA